MVVGGIVVKVCNDGGLVKGGDGGVVGGDSGVVGGDSGVEGGDSGGKGDSGGDGWVNVMWWHLLCEKPRPDSLALAFQQGRPGQSHDEAVIMAWLGSAYLGSAWLSSWLQAGPEQHYIWAKWTSTPGPFSSECTVLHYLVHQAV